MEKVKEALQHISAGKILDVGTGAGSFIPVCKECFKEYTEIIAIDSSERSIEAGKKQFNEDNIEFLLMDAEDMSFEDCSFDTVCISNTLHHLPNRDKVLQEMKRVLKPGGNFIISEMFCDNQSEKQMSHVLLHHLGAKIEMSLGGYHEETFKKDKLIEIAESTGIKIKNIFEYYTEEDQRKDPEFTEEKQKEALDQWFKACKGKMEELKDKPEYIVIKNHIEDLENKLYNIGFHLATFLMIIGKK